jgi:hypothetical protein
MIVKPQKTIESENIYIVDTKLQQYKGLQQQLVICNSHKKFSSELQDKTVKT